MMTTRKHGFALATAAMVLSGTLAGSPASLAATLEGHLFEDVLRLAEQDVQLNGLGVRKVLFIKGYIAGIYLAQKANSYGRIASMPGPKRLQIKMLRSATATDFIDAMVDGIQRNTDPTEMDAIGMQIEQIKRAMLLSNTVANGDVIQFDYLPGEGTVLRINGAVRSQPLVGVDFYNAILKIFIGPHPVDKGLKQGLLGGANAL